MQGRELLKEILQGNPLAINKLKESRQFSKDPYYKKLIGGIGSNINILAMNRGNSFDCWLTNLDSGHCTKVSKSDYEKYFKKKCKKITMDLTLG